MSSIAGRRRSSRRSPTSSRATPAEAAPIARTTSDEAAREESNGAIREVIDDVNDVLLDPFVDLIDAENAWVARGVPTILALLIYGVGLGFLANMMPKQRSHGADWRGAES